MRRWISFLALALLIALSATPDEPEQPTRNLEADAEAVRALLDRVRGRENQPAQQVFQNIELFEGVPAIRVIRMMEKGFAPALGVSCDFCHVPGDWASDEKEHKKVARSMFRMAADTSAKIQEMTGESGATVNCTTCHRGAVQPATEMKSSESH